MELYHKSKDGRILVFDLKGKEEQLKIYREKFDIVLTNEDANFDVVEKILF